MDDSVVFSDGSSGTAPIVISHDLFLRIQRIAATADMEVNELIELVLTDTFNSSEISPEMLASIIRDTPDEI